MPVPPDTRLGRYEIRSQIGAGGMGEVYLAQDMKLDRKVALKILPANVAPDPDRMKRFVHEARAASSLNHPNIITIYEIGETASGHFIATEFIDGETLRERISRGDFELSDTLDIAVQVASALLAAHDAGIVHRDIKPENIMLRRDGIVKVLDFGLAKLIEQTPFKAEAETQMQAQTQAGVIVGTVAYMSPEQARGLDVDARTDVFSMGVVMYEMLTRQSPFAGETISDVIAAILTTEPKPPSSFNQEIPPELDRIVNRTLAKKRDARYRDAKDLLADLRQLQRRLEFKVEAKRDIGVTSEQRNSIAVLPFTNLSADPENEYFCDGLAEELLNALGED